MTRLHGAPGRRSIGMTVSPVILFVSEDSVSAGATRLLVPRVGEQSSSQLPVNSLCE